MLQLASQSPRRRELLAQIGVSYSVLSVSIDEALQADEDAERYVRRLACSKAKAGFSLSPGMTTLGSDTCVAVDGQILGKPVNASDAIRMLTLLSGRSHTVLTAVALCNDTAMDCKVSHTEVWFRAISESEIARYCATGEPLDKAGAYGIQGYAAVFIEKIVGSYSGVMGLPLAETAALCAAFTIPYWETEYTL